MIRYVGIIALLLFLAPTVIYSGSPWEDFNDDALLTQAVLDFQKMHIEELNTFIQYLASCGARKGDQVKEFFCEKDRATYLIKYQKGRAIDSMIVVLDITGMWIDSAGKVAKPQSKEKEEINKAIIRFVDITLKIKEAANRRFQQLSTK